MNTEPRRLQWLQPLPVRFNQGHYILPGSTEPLATFEDVVNHVLPPGQRIPRRIPEIRRALAKTLRFAHNPSLRDQGPWVPKDPAYRIYRSVLIPLLTHQTWQTANVIAAPFLLNLPSRPIAGAVDVIYQLPDGSIAVAALHCERHQERTEQAILTELGGFIAAICDHLLFTPSHAVAIHAAADLTTFHYHHPDVCLGLWVDAVEHHSLLRRLRPLPPTPMP